MALATGAGREVQRPREETRTIARGDFHYQPRRWSFLLNYFPPLLRRAPSRMLPMGEDDVKVARDMFARGHSLEAVLGALRTNLTRLIMKIALR